MARNRGRSSFGSKGTGLPRGQSHDPGKMKARARREAAAAAKARAENAPYVPEAEESDTMGISRGGIPVQDPPWVRKELRSTGVVIDVGELKPGYYEGKGDRWSAFTTERERDWSKGGDYVNRKVKGRTCGIKVIEPIPAHGHAEIVGCQGPYVVVRPATRHVEEPLQVRDIEFEKAFDPLAERVEKLGADVVKVERHPLDAGLGVSVDGDGSAWKYKLVEVGDLGAGVYTGGFGGLPLEVNGVGSKGLVRVSVATGLGSRKALQTDAYYGEQRPDFILVLDGAQPAKQGGGDNLDDRLDLSKPRFTDEGVRIVTLSTDRERGREILMDTGEPQVQAYQFLGLTLELNCLDPGTYHGGFGVIL